MSSFVIKGVPEQGDGGPEKEAERAGAEGERDREKDQVQMITFM